MEFTVDGTITRCGGQAHWSIPLLINGSISVTLRLHVSEIQFDPTADLGETRELIIARLRSAAKEAGAATFAQVRAALEGNTYEL